MSTKDEQEILTLKHYLQLKSEGFEFEGQSYLFWEYMRILTELRVINPNIKFLLENVEMGEKWEKVLSRAIGVNGIHINSALVSAQNRKRIYWCNFGMRPMGLFGDLTSIIEQPKDKGILLKDILETEVDEKYFLSDKMINWLDKHADKRNVDVKKLDGSTKTSCLTATAQTKGNLTTDYIVHNMQLRKADRPSLQKNKNAGGSGHLTRNDGKTYCLDGGNTNAIEIKYEKEIEKSLSNEKATTIDASYYKGFGVRNGACRQVVQVSTNNKSNGGTQPYQQDRVYDIEGISPSLNTDGRSHAVEIVLKKSNVQIEKTIVKNKFYENEVKGLDFYNQSKHDKMPTLANPSHGHLGVFDTSRIRRLTPKECMRLQTVDDNYLMPVSDSQKYKMLGNGWTIDVIAHLLSYLKSI
jgi:site-specific DNA-cytosine methylase